MKRRLNILCVIVMLVLSYSVLEAGYYFFVGLKGGMEAAKEMKTDVSMAQKLMNMKEVNLVPHSFSMHDGDFFSDSVYNEKSGTYMPVIYSSMVVSVDTHPAFWERVAERSLPLLQIALYIWAVVLFVRLIISINQSDIFKWKNVRRLRYLGATLVGGFGCTLFTVYLTCRNINEVFSLRGYDLHLSGMVDVTILVLGLCALIVGEVFAIGLKMKEEQDLTI